MIVRKRDGNRLCRFPFFCVERRGEEKEKKRKKVREEMYWPVKPEWRLLTGGGLWYWYEKICGERLLPAGAGMEVIITGKCSAL